jgi:hypothetical protein
MSQFEAFATLTGNPQINNLAVGVAATSVTFTGKYPQIARCRISNLSGSATVGITISDDSVAVVPQVNGTAMVASATTSALNAGDGIRIQPGATLELNLGIKKKIWLIASAASTPVQVTVFAQND